MIQIRITGTNNQKEGLYWTKILIPQKEKINTNY